MLTMEESRMSNDTIGICLYASFENMVFFVVFVAG